MIMTVGTKLQRWPRTGVAPWSHHAKGRFVHSRERLDPTNDFLVIVEQLPLCFSVEDGGRVDGENVARVHAGPRPLQCEKGSDDDTCAGEQDKRRSDLCYNKQTLTALGAGCPKAAARKVQCTGCVDGKTRDKSQNRRCDNGEHHADPQKTGVDSQI